MSAVSQNHTVNQQQSKISTKIHAEDFRQQNKPVFSTSHYQSNCYSDWSKSAPLSLKGWRLMLSCSVLTMTYYHLGHTKTHLDSSSHFRYFSEIIRHTKLSTSWLFYSELVWRFLNVSSCMKVKGQLFHYQCWSRRFQNEMYYILSVTFILK